MLPLQTSLEALLQLYQPKSSPCPMREKEKRQPESKETSSKKVIADHTNRPLLKVKILQQEDQWSPVIASSPGILIPSNVTLKAYRKPRATLQHPATEFDSIDTCEILLQAQNHPNISYVGREEDTSGQESTLKNYVGLFDSSNGVLQVLEARKVTMRGKVQIESQEVTKKNNKITNLERRNELGQIFGTRKAKKAIASLTDNAISPQKSNTNTKPETTTLLATSAFTTSVLNSMAARTSSMPTREQLEADADANKPRPKAELAAEKLEDVYTIEVLVGTEQMNNIQVKDWLDTIEQEQNVKSNSLFVANKVKGIAARKDVKMLKLLRYLSHLVDFHNAVKTAGRNKSLPKKEFLEKLMPAASRALVEGVRRKFSDSGDLTPWYLDYLRSHIAAIALTISNFEMDINSLREDLRFSETKEMAKYFLEIGCRVANPTQKEALAQNLTKAEAASHKIARLKLPLEFPKVRRIPMKGRGR